MTSWCVCVHHPAAGEFGSVEEDTEELARAAALSRYGREGLRADRGDGPRLAIYEDDEFDVRRRP